MNITTIAITTNELELNTTTNIISTKEPEISDIASIGLFLGYLAGGFFIVFVMIGICILSHTVYMKYLKKPWSEKPSKSVWFIEIEKKKENLSAGLRNNLAKRQILNNEEEEEEDDDDKSNINQSISEHVSESSDSKKFNSKIIKEDDVSNVNKAYIQSASDLSIIVKDDESRVDKYSIKL